MIVDVCECVCVWIFNIYLYLFYVCDAPIVKSECGWTYFTLLEIENQLPRVRCFFFSLALDVSSGFISIFLHSFIRRRRYHLERFFYGISWIYAQTKQTKDRENSNVMKALLEYPKKNREFHMQFVRKTKKFAAWKCEVRISLIHVIPNECEPLYHWVVFWYWHCHCHCITRSFDGLSTVKKTVLPLLLCVCYLFNLSLSSPLRFFYTNNIQLFYSTLESRCKVWWVLQLLLHACIHTRAVRCALRTESLLPVCPLYLMWMTNCHKQDIFMGI